MNGDPMPGSVRTLFEEALGSLPGELRAKALTHVSYANEHPGLSSNERLEFLGDAVISLAVADHLVRTYPHAAEGELTRMRARFVSGSYLAGIALEAGLGDLLLLGRGEETTGGRRKQRNLAGALEAVVGAYFVQHGWSRARELVERTVLKGGVPEIRPDPKTALQELVQRRRGATLEYRVLRVDGPDHMPTFTSGVFIDGEEVARGTGASKKEAEENAARRALELYRCGSCG